MMCPNLKDLSPCPSPDKKGWPWTEESPPMPETMYDGQSWPRITIVTPSYNQGTFIEESIRSVLLQGYPNLEYFVVDGGSSDQSVEVIRKYERYMASWVSERDKGQSDALRKGFGRATGEILGWINSDDMLAPGALHEVAGAWTSQRPALVAGTVENFLDGQFGKKHMTFRQQHISLGNLLSPWLPDIVWHQPGILFSAGLYKKVGGIDPKWHRKMDYDLFLRMLAQDNSISYLSRTVAYFRQHPGAKTAIYSPVAIEEHRRVTAAYLHRLSRTHRLRLQSYYVYTSFVMFVKRLLLAQLGCAKEHMKMFAQVRDPSVIVLAIGWVMRYACQRLQQVITSSFPGFFSRS